MKLRKRRKLVANRLTVNPFVSEAQRRKCWAADDPAWDCHEWSHATKDLKSLPSKVGEARKKAKRKLTANKGKVRTDKGRVGPNKVDPSRTLTLRRWMATQLRKRFGVLKGRIYKLVVQEDAFGLLLRQPLSFNSNPEGCNQYTGPGCGGSGKSHDVVTSGLADSANFADATPDHIAAIVSGVTAGSSVGGKTLKLRSVQVVDNLPVGKDEGGLGYSGGNVYVTKKFLADSQLHNPSAREAGREFLKGTGAERNVSWQDASTPAEAIRMGVAHEMGHHASIALLLDVHKGVRDAKDAGADLSEKEIIKLSGYSSDHPEEMFAEAHAFVSTGRAHKLPPGVKKFYDKALATADPEPIASFIRNEFNPDQQRDEHGRWTAASAALSAVVDSVKAAGALAVHVEHAVSAYVKDGIGKAVARLPSPLQGVAKGAFIGGKALTAVAFANWTLGQNLAERVSRERGATDEEARRLRGVLSTIDSKTFEAFKVTALVGVHAAHLPAVVTGTVPAATTAYLCYSTARDPLATVRAATKMVKGVVPEQRLAGGEDYARNAAIDQVYSLDRTLLAHGYDDWYIALLSAALDHTGNVADAVTLADGLYALSPEQPAVTPSSQEDDGRKLFGLTANSPREGEGRWVTLEGGQHVFISGGVIMPHGPDGGTDDGRQRPGYGATSQRDEQPPEGHGGQVAGATQGPGVAGADQGGVGGTQPAGETTHQGVPAIAASKQEVDKRLDRYQTFFREHGQHEVAGFLDKLREHVNHVGTDEALRALGEEVKGKGEDVQYGGFNLEGKHDAAFVEAYLDRHGISLVHGTAPEGEKRAVSTVTPSSDAEGFHGRGDARDVFPVLQGLRDKLHEAQHLPGLEKSEDIGKLMGGEFGSRVPNLTPDVTARLDDHYGKGQWIVKSYGDEAYAGYGIYFPQRAAQVEQDARATVWTAGEHLDKYGFKLGRNPDTGQVFGLVHKSGDIYQFGTKEYEETINGDARYWADKVGKRKPDEDGKEVVGSSIAENEKGAALPVGSFMAQPAFPVVGVSNEERAQGITFKTGQEGRVHVTTKDGVASVVPHSTWLKGEGLPVVFESHDTRAMAKAAQDAINALPESERRGQLYAPDIVKTKDGYRVVEANPANEAGASGYLQDNPFIIDSYVSHLTGREPAHVSFVRKLLSARPSKSGAEPSRAVATNRVTYNTRWQFATSADKVKAFQDWLRAQVKDTLTSVSDEELWHRYIEAGFRKGAGRSYDDVKRKAAAAGGQDALDFYSGTRDEFLRDSFAQPVTREKVELLAGRAYDDLEGVTEDMGLRMSRSLADGLVQGKSPLDVARDLNDDLELGKDRSILIARTEVVRAHAEGQLTALEGLGVDEIGVAVEWSSTGDGKVCPQCQPLQGVVLTVDEARGLLPRHPNCRCAFTPANVGEDEEGQKRSKPDIDTALKESVEAEVTPKGTGRGKKGVPAKPRESDWAGADLDVDEQRPVQEPLTPPQVANLADGDLLDLFQGSVDNARKEFFAECARDDKGHCTAGEGGGGKAPDAEHEASRKKAMDKIAKAPVPPPEKKAAYNAKVEKYLAAAKKAREEGKKEPQQREFLDARGNTGDRKRRALQLFKEFGGEDKGYVVCPWTGIKMHWTDDKVANPKGYPKFEQGKIFTAVQGGGYQPANLIPESFAANRARGNTPARKENL